MQKLFLQRKVNLLYLKIKQTIDLNINLCLYYKPLKTIQK